MKYPASANFDAAIKAVAVLYNNENKNLCKKEEKMMFQIMCNLIKAYSAYWNRQQVLVAEDTVEAAEKEGRLSQEEAKFLRKTLRGHLA